MWLEMLNNYKDFFLKNDRFLESCLSCTTRYNYVRDVSLPSNRNSDTEKLLKASHGEATKVGCCQLFYFQSYGRQLNYKKISLPKSLTTPRYSWKLCSVFKTALEWICNVSTNILVGLFFLNVNQYHYDMISGLEDLIEDRDRLGWFSSSMNPKPLQQIN